MSRNLVVPSAKKTSWVECCQPCATEFLQQHQGSNKILLLQSERGLHQQEEAPEFVSALYKYCLQHRCYCKVPPRCVMRCRQRGQQNAVDELVIPLTQHRRLAAAARELILLPTTELLVLCILLESTWHARKL